MENPPSKTRSPGRRRLKRVSIWGACLLAVSLAVWQGVLTFVPGPSVEPVVSSPGVVDGASDGQWSATSPSRMASDPLAGSGLEPFKGDPGDIRPPDGAKRRYGFARVAVGERHEQANYEFAGAPDAAAQHYLRALREAGYAIASDGADSLGRRRLVGMKNAARVNVSLRKTPAQEKIVVITVTMMRPLE